MARAKRGRWGEGVLGALLVRVLAGHFEAASLPADSPYGWPKGGAIFATRLVNSGFVVRYHEWFGAPEWVAYRADPPARFRLQPRPEQFEPDMRTWRCRLHLWCVTHETYRGSGFDRGHMAPNFLIGTRYGPAAQQATFLLSNIAPQRPEHNRGIWERLERLEANRFAPGADKLWVIVGPVFSAHPPRIGHEQVAVPEAFYRILVREAADGRREAIAFLIPQKAPAEADLRRYIVPINAIEAKTGLDFFPELSREEQMRLQAQPADPLAWGLSDEWATQPPRYTSGHGQHRSR